MAVGGLEKRVEQWLLEGVLLLLVAPPLVVVRLDMAQGHPETIAQLLAVTWPRETLSLAATILR
jgi:hypothetical protein